MKRNLSASLSSRLDKSAKPSGTISNPVMDRRTLRGRCSAPKLSLQFGQRHFRWSRTQPCSGHSTRLPQGPEEEAMLRQPAVAGRFYPADPTVLRADLKSYLSPSEERVRAIGCIVPHAGYMYSGQVAGAVWSRVEIPQRLIILCPNHTGRGHPLAVMDQGEWLTPLGNVPIDGDLAAQLLDAFPALAKDSEAHRSEHAIEVELPFLQVTRPGATFVPIAVEISRPLLLENLGDAIANVIRERA